MKYALIYGILAGAIAISVITASIVLVGAPLAVVRLSGHAGGADPHLRRREALSRRRERRRDPFLPAFGLGLGMAIVAGIAYVIGWEIYVAATDYAFMDEYIASVRHAREAAARPRPGARAAIMAELEAMRVQYANPLFRLPMVFLEIFPVGLLVALVSAALLRNPEVPALGGVSSILT